MSANELEHLMSQLNVDTVLPGHVNSLGILIQKSKAGYVWRYPNQQTTYRNGKLRLDRNGEPRPLPNDYSPKTHFPNGNERPKDENGNVKLPKIYIPENNDWLQDWQGDLMPRFTVKTKNNEIDWNAMDKNEIIKMWIHEYNLKRHFEQMYYRSIHKHKGQAQGNRRNTTNRPVRISGITAPRQQNKSAPKSGTAKAKPAGF